ncbi:MAG: hypothetical protein JWN95_1730 [Frankiales bacterium]|nr:hypothetical protein [Frankiales bacterium]
MAVRLAAMYSNDQMPRSMDDLAPRPEEPVRVGDVIAVTPLGTRTPINLFPTMGISRPGTDRWPVLMTELDEISQWVRTQAVPRLITGTEPPEHPLPTRYEIAVAHLDERDAISAGSMTSASDHHKERLVAATLRIQLVDLIGGIAGSPNEHQIAAWLASLADDQVLARTARWKPSFDHNPGVMRQNIEVLKALHDEAITFTRDGQRFRETAEEQEPAAPGA